MSSELRAESSLHRVSKHPQSDCVSGKTIERGKEVEHKRKAAPALYDVSKTRNRCRRLLRNSHPRSETYRGWGAAFSQGSIRPKTKLTSLRSEQFIVENVWSEASLIAIRMGLLSPVCKLMRVVVKIARVSWDRSWSEPINLPWYTDAEYWILWDILGFKEIYGDYGISSRDTP